MQTGYFRVRYLRRGYGAGLASVIVPADSAEVARAMVIGSGVAIPGTVREAEPADTVDTMLARECSDGIYPEEALRR